jgi:hypothetical protein
VRRATEDGPPTAGAAALAPPSRAAGPSGPLSRRDLVAAAEQVAASEVRRSRRYLPPPGPVEWLGPVRAAGAAAAGVAGARAALLTTQLPPARPPPQAKVARLKDMLQRNSRDKALSLQIQMQLQQVIQQLRDATAQHAAATKSQTDKDAQKKWLKF